ncbi:hypothetical protein [Mycobacterium sp. RTGN3]|uniref:hypothetical protein n=1 Tax=Mycobacterium sp. RTGN3 TaxID=3016524 RepID=UPI0029C85275|nr:hypothetical protein [Mycobacterium sp. RTGN3]
MSGDYDVDARLAQGRPAVDDIGEYVRACQQLGYHHPDLTVHPADAYSGEDGLRLDALAADVAALTAVAAAADDAVWRQSEILATLPGAWSGQGAGVALDFLTRHQRAAVTVSAAVREAADAITALRDELWRAIDAKVSATLAIDASHQGQRAAWLAAARTVTTGVGDLASASELIDQQVKPFVDNDVRVDWLPAMRAGSARVEAAYAAAIARVRGAPDAVFEVPGGLGPQWTAPVEHDGQLVGSGGAAAGPAVGAALGAPALVTPAAAPTPSPAPSSPLASPAPLAQEPPTAAPAPPSLPPLGELGGTPSLGTGLSGFGQQLGDLLGGLTGAAGDASPELDPPELETDDEPFDERDPDDDPDVDPEEDEDDEPGAEGEPTDPAAAAPEVPIAPEAPPEPAPEPAPTPVPPPMPEPGLQDVATEPPGQTPCEIAADELPQVGE